MIFWVSRQRKENPKRILISGSLAAILLFSMPAALADEWDYLLAEAQRKNYTSLQIYMMGQEYMAKIYQKEVLHFDYDKIQKKDKGFKAPVETEHKQKKTIQKLVWLK